MNRGTDGAGRWILVTITRGNDVLSRLLRIMGANYLSVFALVIPVSIIFNFQFREETIGAFSFRLVSGSLLVVLATFVALVSRRDGVLNRYWMVTSFLGLATWLILFLIAQIGGTALEYSAFYVPIVLAVTIVRPVGIKSVRNAMASLAIGLIAAVLLTELSMAMVGPPDWLVDQMRVGSRWGISSTLLGLDESWKGLFGWPSTAGLAGMFLMVYGLGSRSKVAVLSLVAGTLMVLAAQRHTPLLGLAAGVLVLLWFGSGRYFALVSQRLRRIAVPVAIVGAVAFVFLTDPTLNGRDSWWASCTSLWLQNPLFGYSLLPNGSALADQTGCSYAHALSLQVLVQYGLVAATVMFVFVGFVAFVAVRAARKSYALGLSLIAAFLVSGLAETHGDFLYLNFAWFWFILAALYASLSLGLNRTSSQVGAGELHSE